MEALTCLTTIANVLREDKVNTKQLAMSSKRGRRRYTMSYISKEDEIAQRKLELEDIMAQNQGIQHVIEHQKAVKIRLQQQIKRQKLKTKHDQPEELTSRQITSENDREVLIKMAFKAISFGSAANVWIDENVTPTGLVIKGGVTTVDDEHPFEFRLPNDADGEDEITRAIWNNIKNAADSLNRWDEICSGSDDQPNSSTEYI